MKKIEGDLKRHCNVKTIEQLMPRGTSIPCLIVDMSNTMKTKLYTGLNLQVMHMEVEFGTGGGSRDIIDEGNDDCEKLLREHGLDIPVAEEVQEIKTEIEETPIISEIDNDSDDEIDDN
jgi:hypothetical protein